MIYKLISKIFHGVMFFSNLIFFYLMYPISYLLYGNKHIWLISEINFDARDNGYSFFKYLRKEQPCINCVYLIDKDNRNYLNVVNLGKTVKPHSLKHFLFFISAECIISTIVHGSCPNKYIVKAFQKKKLVKGKYVNLKHGIYKDFSEMDLKSNAHLDLIICGTDPEYNYILKTYGYDKDQVVYTGLARFDTLDSSFTKNEILVMPTWRRWLDPLSKNEFYSTTFFKCWSELVKMINENQLIKNGGIKIVFFVHPKMTKFLECFKSIAPNIIFCDAQSSNLQHLINESMMLITDYSSVFFDFAYLKKPVIYYQFDENDFYGQHYKKSYFDYRVNGFGPVATSAEQTILHLKNILAGKNDSKYLANISKTFLFMDTRNCERIFKEITRIIE